MARTTNISFAWNGFLPSTTLTVIDGEPPALTMRFTSVAPNLATPGDQVYVSGENVDNIFNVVFHPTVTVDGFGKRHVIIDGIEYIEL